jgi:hypothetical protein
MATQLLRHKMQFFQHRWDEARHGHLLRDAVVFAAGAEALHTLGHIWWGVSAVLPMTDPWLPTLTMTPGLNLFAIVINGSMTAALLYGAHALKRGMNVQPRRMQAM